MLLCASQREMLLNVCYCFVLTRSFLMAIYIFGAFIEIFITAVAWREIDYGSLCRKFLRVFKARIGEMKLHYLRRVTMEGRFPLSAYRSRSFTSATVCN